LNLTIIILAAGQGTRMKSDLPKVMHSLAGWPMVRYVVEVATALQPTLLTAVVGHGAELVRQALGEQIMYVTQAERLGTAHATLQAEQAAAACADTVLVLYGDTPLVRVGTLRRVVEHHQTKNAAVTLLSFYPDDPTGYGRIERDAADGTVRAIVEEAEATEGQRAIREANSGILCFRDGWLWPNLHRLDPRAGGELYLTDLVALARKQGEMIEALPVDDPLEVMGLDQRLRLSQAEAEIRRRINEQWMLSGVTLVHPETTYIEAGVEIGADTVVWPNTLLQGGTRIGRNCSIGPGTVIRASTIGDGCRVELSVVEQAIMEDGSDVGPFGHLRKGAHLGIGAHVGNFGEIKNSSLGDGAKMGHFSYLGDAEVGAGANIGAGTVTCNYDGERKHRTTIGDGAFVGSDTMLVAPVVIGDGARTGAGSVVTRDVPPGSMAYGVPAKVKPQRAREESEGD
jgi:bifunctional UDP-N-acetylglucosamine pyrophosphorylase/glucosamine-1-phosphate N-acetyltransferase